MVTINDVAKAAGVAKSTVSNVLSGKRFVKEELIDKVMKACNELNYKPNFFASNVMSRRTNIIGLFLEQNKSNTFLPFYNYLIESVLVEADKNNYNLMIYYNMRADKIVPMLQKGRSPIDGAVMLAPKINDSRLQQFVKNQIDCVVIGSNYSNAGLFTTVDVDNKGLVAKITQNLLDKGHKNIYLFNSDQSLTISSDRAEGFLSVVSQGSAAEDKIFYIDSYDATAAYKTLNRLKSENKQVDAVITASDILAKGIYDYCSEHSLTPGKELSVIALGGETYIKNLSPQLSYAYQDYRLIGTTAVKLLVNMLDGKEYSDKLVESMIHYRESVNENFAVR